MSTEISVTTDPPRYLPFECYHCGQRVLEGGACGCLTAFKLRPENLNAAPMDSSSLDRKL